MCAIGNYRFSRITESLAMQEIQKKWKRYRYSVQTSISNEYCLLLLIQMNEFIIQPLVVTKTVIHKANILRVWITEMMNDKTDELRDWNNELIVLMSQKKHVCKDSGFKPWRKMIDMSRLHAEDISNGDNDWVPLSNISRKQKQLYCTI